jgi:hypothetical protein
MRLQEEEVTRCQSRAFPSEHKFEHTAVNVNKRTSEPNRTSTTSLLPTVDVLPFSTFIASNGNFLSPSVRCTKTGRMTAGRNPLRLVNFIPRLGTDECDFAEIVAVGLSINWVFLQTYLQSWVLEIRRIRPARSGLPNRTFLRPCLPTRRA